MIRVAVFLCAFCVAGYAWADDGDEAAAATPAFGSVEDKEAARLHNGMVTDGEINEYFEFMIQSDADALAEWRGLAPEVRAERIASYRKVHDDAGMKIDVLRDLTPESRAQLEAMAPFMMASAASADSARTRLLAYDDAEYRAVLAAGIALITARRNGAYGKPREYGWTQLHEDFPPEIEFLHVELIRVMKDSCEIYLHKGMGKGIGLEVRWVDDERWVLSSFDEYEAWTRTEIKLDAE